MLLRERALNEFGERLRFAYQYKDSGTTAYTLPRSSFPRYIRINSHDTAVFYRRASLSDLQQTPADGNRYRVSPVIRSELIHQILDMKIDSCLGDR